MWCTIIVLILTRVAADVDTDDVPAVIEEFRRVTQLETDDAEVFNRILTQLHTKLGWLRMKAVQFQAYDQAPQGQIAAQLIQYARTTDEIRGLIVKLGELNREIRVRLLEQADLAELALEDGDHVTAHYHVVMGLEQYNEYKAISGIHTTQLTTYTEANFDIIKTISVLICTLRIVDPEITCLYVNATTPTSGSM